jgi:hypothetical protein
MPLRNFKLHIRNLLGKKQSKQGGIMPDDGKLDMTISLKVDGKEGLNLELKYLNTDMATVLLVEKRLADTIAGLLNDQIDGKL